MIDDADSLDAKDVNDAKRVIMKSWLFMRKSDWDTFGNKNFALRTKYIVAARLFRDLGSPHVREVSHANIIHLILYLHHGFKLELDDDGYAELLKYKAILSAIGETFETSHEPPCADPATLKVEKPNVYKWVYFHEPPAEPELDEQLIHQICLGRHVAERRSRLERSVQMWV